VTVIYLKRTSNKQEDDLMNTEKILLPEDVISKEEAANILGISMPSVYTYIKDGKLNEYKNSVGASVLSREEVEDKAVYRIVNTPNDNKKTENTKGKVETVI